MKGWKLRKNGCFPVGEVTQTAFDSNFPFKGLNETCWPLTSIQERVGVKWKGWTLSWGKERNWPWQQQCSLHYIFAKVVPKEGGPGSKQSWVILQARAFPMQDPVTKDAWLIFPFLI